MYVYESWQNGGPGSAGAKVGPHGRGKQPDPWPHQECGWWI